MQVLSFQDDIPMYTYAQAQVILYINTNQIFKAGPAACPFMYNLIDYYYLDWDRLQLTATVDGPRLYRVMMSIEFVYMYQLIQFE